MNRLKITTLSTLLLLLAASCGVAKSKDVALEPTNLASATTRPAPDTSSVPLPAQPPLPATTPPASPPSSSPASPTTTLPPQPPESPAIAVVSDFYAALNVGARPAAALTADAATELFLLLAAGELDAFFEAECSAAEPLEIAARVDCEELVVDAFYGPAGILIDGSASFSVYGDRVDIDDGYDCRAPTGLAWEYLVEFDSWLVREGHAPILNRDGEGGPDRPCTPYPFGAADAPSHLDLAAEFRADSDRYPLGEAEALAAVHAYYAQIASGDWDLVRGVHRLGSGSGSSKWLEQAIAFNATFEHDCRVERIEPSLTEPTVVHVKCVEVMSDDFFRPGGISRESAITYAVENGSMSVIWGRPCWATETSRLGAQYIYEFQQWRSANGQSWIPGIITLFGTSEADVPCGPYPFSDVPNEETVALVRSLLDEFVAASPDWPNTE